MSIRVICLGFAAATLFAQGTSQFTGRITDASGAVVAGASVSVINSDTGVAREIHSNELGYYTAPLLQPGNYRIVVQKAGFKPNIRTGLVLETGFTRTVDFELAVGELAETIRVEANAPLLESETSSVGQFIERSSVLNMPLQSRRSGSLVRLAGMVIFTGEDGNGPSPHFTIAGGRSNNQMWHLDGATVQRHTLGAPGVVINPPSEALQEFKVEVNNYSAEFGRNGGGVIVMTTRSGSNELHGAVYEFLRNDALDTRTFFARGKDPLRYNIFGASAGGPVVRNRTFFFVNYEGSRRRDAQTIASTAVPHPAEIGGDFSARRDVRVLDPLTRAPFPNNIIPANRVDPLGKAFAQFWPAPNVPADNIALAPRDNYITSVSARDTRDFLTARADHAFTRSDQTYVRVSWVRSPRLDASVYPVAAADFRGQSAEGKAWNALASWIRNISPAMFNQFRYGYTRVSNITRALGTGSGVNGRVGLKGVDPNDFPLIAVTGLTSLGKDGQERIQTPQVGHQLIDNLMFIKGNHQLKTGFEFRYSRNLDDFNQTIGGSFTFSDRATGSGLASLLLGWTTSAALLDTDLLNTRSNYYGAYFQDDWKVAPSLTLNLGLRWEMDTPRWETHNRQSGFDPYRINPVSGTPGVVTFAGRDGASKYAHAFDRNNFGPRFGFAWRVSGRAVVRGGYGIAYSGAYYGGVPFVNSIGFSRNGSFPSPDGGFTPAFLFRDGMPAVPRGELGPGFGAVPVGQNPGLSPDFFSPNQVNGYAQQWNLTVQRELPGNAAVELAYLANVGHKLAGADLNINVIPLVDGHGPTTQNQRLRLFPQFSNVTLLSAPWGNSSYHAMNLKVEKRYSQGLNLLMNYTWSKFIDDNEASGELAGGPGSGYTHPELRRLDKALSGNDIRHRYVASAVYELPWGTARRWPIVNPVLRQILGGWGLGAVLEMRSGATYGTVEQTNRSNTFSASQRPNLLRDPSFSGDRSRAARLAQWFDTSAFEAPPAGFFGNAPRTLCCGPGFFGLDMSANKRWTFAERYAFIFRGDVFNVPNTPNFGLPGLSRGSPAFGRIASILGSTAGRQFQLSLRFQF